MKSGIKIIFILLFIIAIFILLEVLVPQKGIKEHCGKIGIGTSKLFIDLNYKLYRHTHGGWHTKSKCDSTIIYYLDFKSDFLLKRVKKITLLKYLKNSKNENINEANMIMGKYGFSESLVPFTNQKDTTLCFQSKIDKIKGEYSYKINSDDILEIYIAK